MAVSGGEAIEATAVSSNDTTLRSVGTDRPVRRAPSSAPSACASLAAKIAVGGFGPDNNAVTASTASPKSKSLGLISAGSTGIPASSRAAR